MANAKISNNTIFPLETTDVRSIDGLAGYKGAGNIKISGTFLVESVINSNNSGTPSTLAESRVAFYGPGGTSLGGSTGLTRDQSTDTLNIGTPNSAAGLEADVKLHGTYVSGSDQPKLTFVGGNSVDGDFDFQLTTSTDGNDQTWILPEDLPTAGQVLEANAVASNDVTLSWATPASGGGIDFSSLNISTIKADLTQSSQPQYGSAITVKANGAISNGDIVVFNYDTGEVRGEVASTLPAQNTIAGVAIEDIADTATGKVLIYGYATVKYNNFVPPSPAANIALTSSVSGNTTVLTPGVVQPFSDSGGPGGGANDYQNSETYTYIFDSGDDAEQVQLTVNSFDFEGTGSNAWDRLGFQEADDEAGPYVNCAFSPGPDIASYNKGWRRMDEPTWQSGGGGNEDVTQGPYADGYVLPGNNSLGGFTLPQTFTSTKRYVKCFFYSDGSTPSDGWDIDFETTATVSPTNTPIAGRASLDISDLAAATNELSTGRTIGITVGGTFADNSAVIFVEPPRVQ